MIEIRTILGDRMGDHFQSKDSGPVCKTVPTSLGFIMAATVCPDLLLVNLTKSAENFHPSAGLSLDLTCWISIRLKTLRKSFNYRKCTPIAVRKFFQRGPKFHTSLASSLCQVFLSHESAPRKPAPFTLSLRFCPFCVLKILRINIIFWFSDSS